MQHQHRRRVAGSFIDIMQAQFRRHLVVMGLKGKVRQISEACFRCSQYFHFNSLGSGNSA